MRQERLFPQKSKAFPFEFELEWVEADSPRLNVMNPAGHGVEGFSQVSARLPSVQWVKVPGGGSMQRLDIGTLNGKVPMLLSEDLKTNKWALRETLVHETTELQTLLMTPEADNMARVQAISEQAHRAAARAQKRLTPFKSGE